MERCFGEYGKLGHVYLKLADPASTLEKKKKRNIAKKFTEGWVEFETKSIAKKVAALLNNTQVSNRKKSK
ncbi:hypothetical protein NQ314_001743 [Rhamnusium bicolor]|uniref:RRM domain-containing protein n=1 Tax=Rhamnusium bicolor TaxID=1586634 RepID=A0AAV8ZSM4_9CUCU|nr:hypothetical protein NQ314_001743 [Rhamnusium bicolor]